MSSRQSPASLTTGPVGRTLVLFALPALGSNVLQSSNASINAIWVGRYLGEEALAATSSANLILFLLLGGVFGFSIATSVLVGQHIGGKRLEEAKRAVGTSTTFIGLGSIAVTLAGILFTPALLTLMHTPPSVVPLATAYMRVIFVGLPAMFFYQHVMMILRAAGDAKTPLLFMFWSVGIDIALNPLLIFGFGPIPPLGIAGSAVATVVAQTGTLAALLLRLYRHDFALCIRRNELGYLRMSKAVLKVMTLRGVPIALQILTVSSSFLAMLALVNPYGTSPVAAFGAAMQMWTYVQMPTFALSASITAMAAQNIGAGRWDRIPRIANAGAVINAVLTGILVLGLYLFNRSTVSLFLPAQAAAIDIAAHINVITLWGFVVFAVAFAYLAVPRAAGAVIGPMLVIFISFWLLRLPFAMIASQYWAEDGIWWSLPAGHLVCAILALAYYRRGGWRKTRLIERSEPQHAAVQHAGAPEM